MLVLDARQGNNNFPRRASRERRQVARALPLGATNHEPPRYARATDLRRASEAGRKGGGELADDGLRGRACILERDAAERDVHGEGGVYLFGGQELFGDKLNLFSDSILGAPR